MPFNPDCMDDRKNDFTQYTNKSVRVYKLLMMQISLTKVLIPALTFSHKDFFYFISSPEVYKLLVIPSADQ